MVPAMDDKTETGEQAKAGAMIVPVTLFEQNCTIIWHEPSKKAVVIDPGGDVPKIMEAIKQAGVTVEKIWLTHGHIDHVGGAADLRDALQVKIEGPHIADKYLLDNVVSSGERFGMIGVRNFGPDRWLDEGDQVGIGDLTFDILHCPGHSPGSVVFFNKELRFALVGDVLFNGSVGRTDLPGGSHAMLISSIKENAAARRRRGFICGHGGACHRPQRMTIRHHRRDVSEIPPDRVMSGYFINPAAVRARVMTPLTSMPRRFGSFGAGLCWRTGLWDFDHSVAARSDDCRDSVATDGTTIDAGAGVVASLAGLTRPVRPKKLAM
jgi:glyoxylase-like metal-dependent hydrolase (beta-lactamase superfamily II)